MHDAEHADATDAANATENEDDEQAVQYAEHGAHNDDRHKDASPVNAEDENDATNGDEHAGKIDGDNTYEKEAEPNGANEDAEEPDLLSLH